LKTIILIAFEFPPHNSGGSQRPYRFARHLRTFGYEPIILTTPSANPDTSLAAEVQASGLIIRYAPVLPEDWRSKLASGYYLNIQDDTYKRWKQGLTCVFRETVTQYNPDLVLATVPPFSVAGLAVELAKEANLLLVLDWRDAWSQWNVTPYATKWHYLATLKKERQWLQSANHHLVTSAQTQADFLRLHPQVDANHITAIPNSYEGKRTPFQQLSLGSLKLGYVGSFYYNPYSQFLMDANWWQKKPHQFLQFVPRKEKWLYRTPWFLFRTVRYMLDDRPELTKKIEMHFAGKKEFWFDGMVKEHGLTDLVHHHGWLTHTESLDFQQSCDALLLTSSKVVDGCDYSIAGKTFEYIKIGKPILGFVCEGAQRDLLEASGTSVLFDPDNMEQAAKQLGELLDKGIVLRPNTTFLDKLSAHETTKDLVVVIDKLLTSSL